MPHFTTMMNVFTIALLIVFCQVTDARITYFIQTATSNTPNLKTKTATSDEGATLIREETLVFENGKIKKKVRYNSFSIIQTDKASRTPIVDDSKSISFEKATIMATDTPMSDGGAMFFRDEFLVSENDGIENASNYNSLSNIENNKVAAPFKDASKATALFGDGFMNESLQKATIMVPDEKKNTKLEDSKNNAMEKGTTTAAEEAKHVIRKLISSSKQPTKRPTTHTHAPIELASLGIADSFGVACAGAVAIAGNAIIYGNIVTTGAFTTGVSSMVFGDIDCFGAADFGPNSNTSGALISQGAISLGEGGILKGDILSTAAITVAASGKIFGNIYACTAVTLSDEGSVTGQVLQGAAGLQVPSSNDKIVLADIDKAYTYLISHPDAKDLESSIINNALLPGIYFNAAAWIFASGRTLTFNGTSSDTWIIQLKGAAAIFGNIYNVGALPSNIQWAVAGALSIGTGANFCGNIISLAAISVADGASLNGSIYSPLAACTLGSGAKLTKFPMTTRPMPVLSKGTFKKPTKTPTTYAPAMKPTTMPTTHAPIKKLTKAPTSHAPTKKPLLGAANSFGIACGGAVAIAANAVVYSNVVTTGAFSTGDSSTVFGDIDCFGSANLGTNTTFTGTLISQVAVTLGGGIFTGDIFATAAVVAGASEKVVGNIYASKSFSLFPGGSVTGQVLQGDARLQVPLSNDTQVLDDISKAYTYLVSQTVAKDLESSIIDNTLLPGIYFKAAAWSFGAGRTLIFNGTSSDTWIIQLGGAAEIFGNIFCGALPSNIQWAIAGQLTVGTGANFCGCAVSPGAIILEAGASLIGSIYSPSGACAIGVGARLTKLPPTKKVTKKPITHAPTEKPTKNLTTRAPTKKVTKTPITLSPLKMTTKKPTTKKLTKKPTTHAPTKKPTIKPTTHVPTKKPTKTPPTHAPTKKPTKKPITHAPTKKPTRKPSTHAPMRKPSKKPTTHLPTKKPTKKPITNEPTKKPTKKPATHIPTRKPSKKPTTPPPTKKPTMMPTTHAPTKKLTKKPTSLGPTKKTSKTPTAHAPTNKSTKTPTTHAPIKKPLLGAADTYGIACGGVVVIARKYMHGNIVTSSAFNSHYYSTVFGDVDCYGAASLDENSNFSGTLISQSAVSLGGVVETIPEGGLFAGDIFSTALVTIGASEKVVGNIYACSNFTLCAGGSVTGQVLQGVNSSNVPPSNATKTIADIDKAYAYLQSQPSAKDLESSIINNALLPGVYLQAAAWTFGAGRTLTFNGTSSDTWIIQFGGAATIGGNIYCVGALPSNIRWAVTGQLLVQVNSNFCGYVVAVGAINFEAGASLRGSMYSPAGACTLGDGARLTQF